MDSTNRGYTFTPGSGNDVHTADATERHDTNWDDITTATPAFQSDGIPLIGNFTLYNITPVLEEKGDVPFDEWLKKVMSMLNGCRIANVVNSSISRPFRDDLGAKNWLRTSQAVVTWLQTGISREIMAKMEATGKAMVLADNFMDFLKTTMRGKGMFAMMSQFIPIFGSIEPSSFS